MLFQPIYTIFSFNRESDAYSFYAIFRGVSPMVLAGQNFWLTSIETDCLIVGNAYWNDLIGAPMLFWVIVDGFDGGVMVQLSKGSSVIRTSTKWLGVWTIERCICDATKHTCMTQWWDDSNHPDTYVQDELFTVYMTSVKILIDHWLAMMMLSRQWMWLCVLVWQMIS